MGDEDCEIDLDHILVKTGQPVPEILAVVEDGTFDVVIMGICGKVCLKKMIGSVARQIVELCSIPVLTVRFPERFFFT